MKLRHLQILDDLKNNLSKDFLEAYGLDLLSIQRTVFDESFKKFLLEMIQNNDYSCRAVFNLCQKMLPNIINNNSDDGLLIIYRYALQKIYPHVLDLNFSKEMEAECVLYLLILQIISKYQKVSSDNTWQSRYPVLFLEENEINKDINLNEYNAFIKVYRSDFVYEMMKLSYEVMGFNTLDHICGVANIAMKTARKLKKLGFSIDLGCVLGSALAHDIGKYGCTQSEFSKVPYLHYYYTDIWFKRHGISIMGHIATNHSTWDLELENLPIESLVLIYSDFRVKNKVINNKSNMFIYSLDEAFEVILDKLDNVDSNKLLRYKKVYSKLHDFESFINNMQQKGGLSPEFYPLLQGEEIVSNIKYLAVYNNIKLMHKLKDEASLGMILETARSQKDWHSLRDYIRVIDEYSTYFTQKQKLLTISFLYDMLLHPDDDIRKNSAILIGTLIAKIDESYKKELPLNAYIEKPKVNSVKVLHKYINQFLNPDHKILKKHKYWIGYCLSPMIGSFFLNADKNNKDSYIEVINTYCIRHMELTEDSIVFLLEAIRNIPYEFWERQIFDFILKSIESPSESVRLCAYEILINIKEESIYKDYIKEKAETLIAKFNPNEMTPVYKYIKYKLLNLNIDYIGDIDTAEIFLKNLKSSTSWIVKRVYIALLFELVDKEKVKDPIHTAMHFCNIIKVSEVEGVRNIAGEALVKLVPSLSKDQRNDISIELLRSLEISGYRFAEYIPLYLGQILLNLAPYELDELIEDLVEKIKQSNERINKLLLKTIGIFISYYPQYIIKHKEPWNEYEKRLIKILGIILNGLADYNDKVRQAAIGILGREIFGSKTLELTKKEHIFVLCVKKLLTLVFDNNQDELMFFSNAAALNHIYRFIVEYTSNLGDIIIKKPERVAFFPGTFDPFSVGHKKIALAIRDLGFEVYLAVDEFSWSKRTHPHNIRKNIIHMSISDQLGVYVFPEFYQINISNEEDLILLRNCFRNSNISIVVGSDVITNASAYKKDRTANSIHSFNHIVFERKSSINTVDFDTGSIASDFIDGDILTLSLEAQYEDISSTQIRDYVDMNRDISTLVDPLVQKYIYDFGFYLKEPQYKLKMGEITLKIEVLKSFDRSLIEELSCFLGLDIYQYLKKSNCRVILIKDVSMNNKIVAFSVFHRIDTIELYSEFEDSDITQYIRQNAKGRMCIIDLLFFKSCDDEDRMLRVILSDTLSYCVSREFSFFAYIKKSEDREENIICETLKLYGFLENTSKNQKKVFMVDASCPCTLNLDIKRTLKEPFLSNERVLSTIYKNRKRLQSNICSLYPGKLLLTYDRSLMHERLISKICSENDVLESFKNDKKYGKAMCVPFGDMLNRYIIPNTVTKTLHTEKVFMPDMKSYTIGESPHYLSLELQVRMIKSFMRPIILVDDLLNKGYRIKALEPVLRNQGIEVQKIIVGILSARGRELMDLIGRDVDCVYYIPKLKLWFNESDMYPFVGGHMVWRGSVPKRNLIPSVNLILPYTSPSFIKGADPGSIIELSRMSIINCSDLFEVLEEEYQNIYERKLTIESLGQIFISPRSPDHGADMNYNLNLSPSHYIKNDMEKLIRLEKSLK